MEDCNCRILINGLSGVFVLDDPNPTFTLQAEACAPFDSWQVRVLDSGEQPVWASGLIEAGLVHVRYAGDSLLPRTRYAIVIDLLSDGRLVHSISSIYETGFLGSSWSAGWIEPEQEPGIAEEVLPFFMHFTQRPDFLGGHTRLRPCLELQKTFDLSDVPDRARVYASAHGVYELRVNGVRMPHNLLSPETSTYQKQLYYQTFDVASALVVGENRLEIVLADGWWIGRIGLSGDSCQYGDRIGLLLEADLSMPDGSLVQICSDESFLSRRTNIDYSDLFIGEHHDYTRPDDPWTGHCLSVDFDMDNLVAQPTSPLAEHAVFDPTFLVTPEGDLLADFGQCLSGVADITVEALSGTEVVLDFTEVLDENGNFLRNILGRNKDQRDVFICQDGLTRFYPRFTYHGFRYVRLSGVSREQIQSLKAVAIGTPIEPRGDFSCSDERINQLQHCIRWSMLSNMFSVPTDCPQREKAGWTGDILSFAPTGCFNYDLHGFLSSWLSNMRDEQFSNGAVPVVVPNYPMQESLHRQMSGDSSSSAWSDACILVPWYLYQAYGDDRILEDNFEMMEKWLAFVAGRCQEKPDGFDSLPEPQRRWNDYLWNKGYHFGDWFVPSMADVEDKIKKTEKLTRDVIGSAFYALSVETMIDVIGALLEGRPEREDLALKKQSYVDLLDKIRTAVRDCFVSDSGLVQNDFQGLYVMVLKAGIVEGELRQKVADRLVTLICENDGRLDTGFVSVPYLLDVLTDNGHRDVALELLFQTQSPSWLYMVGQGATAIWENWEAIRPDGHVTTSSFNHYTLGSVGSWIYRQIGGIQPVSPGCREVVFDPDIYCGLEHAKSSIRTYYGTVSCSWRWEGGSCRICLEIPPRVEAVFEGGQLKPGSHTFIR